MTSYLPSCNPVEGFTATDCVDFGGFSPPGPTNPPGVAHDVNTRPKAITDNKMNFFILLLLKILISFLFFLPFRYNYFKINIKSSLREKSIVKFYYKIRLDLLCKTIY